MPLNVGKGWHGESQRHSLARRGVKTSYKTKTSGMAMPKSVAKVDVTLSLKEAKDLKGKMEKRGHKCGIDKGAFGYRLWIPGTKKAVEDYNALTGRELKYVKKQGVFV